MAKQKALLSIEEFNRKLPVGLSLGKDGANGKGSWRLNLYWTAEDGKKKHDHFTILKHGWENACKLAYKKLRQVRPDVVILDDRPEMPAPIVEMFQRHVEEERKKGMGGVRIVPTGSAYSWVAMGFSTKETGVKQRCFSILRYGYEEAHRLACEVRRKVFPSDLPNPEIPPMSQDIKEWLALRHAEMAVSEAKRKLRSANLRRNKIKSVNSERKDLRDARHGSGVCASFPQ